MQYMHDIYFMYHHYLINRISTIIT